MLQSPDINTIMQAMYFASISHRNQKRGNDDATPYINHPIEAARFLTSNGITDTETIAGCLLHDVLEDTSATEHTIKSFFSQEIVDLVKEVTDAKSSDKIQKKRAQVADAKLCSDKAKLIKLADKYSNLFDLLIEPPSGWTKEEIRGYGYWCMGLCRSGLYGVNPMIDEEMKKLFNEHNLDNDICPDMLNQEIENYYRIINNSD
jgi:GTP diphosphokinase / guanosine-3',5'-bis(diphosphate) 3'-diphosphatase